MTHASARSTSAVALLISLAACQWLERGPGDAEIAAVVRKTPPAPPTLGPTYLSAVESVTVDERGRYNGAGHYWPVRVRIKGSAQVEPRMALLLAPLSDPRKSPPSPVEFVEEARFTKDDFGKWQVAYHYGDDGPRWRRSEQTRP